MDAHLVEVNIFVSIRILVAIAGVFVLPSIILGDNVTTVTTFNSENVSRSNYIDNTVFNTDVCGRQRNCRRYLRINHPKSLTTTI